MLRGMGAIGNLADGATQAADKPLSQQLTDVFNSAANAVATTVPVIEGKLPPPGYIVDPKTGKFIPNPAATTTPGGMPGGSSFNAQKYLPWVIGGALVLGIGYFGLKRMKRRR